MALATLYALDVARKRDSPESLPARRFRLLAEQLAGTQAERGEALGLHQTEVGRVLRGERGPSVEALSRAVLELGVSSEFFFDPLLGERPNHRAHRRNVVGLPRSTCVDLLIEERRRSGRPVVEAAADRAREIGAVAHAITRTEAAAILDLAETIATREASGPQTSGRVSAG